MVGFPQEGVPFKNPLLNAHQFGGEGLTQAADLYGNEVFVMLRFVFVSNKKSSPPEEKNVPQKKLLQLMSSTGEKPTFYLAILLVTFLGW